MSNLNSIKVYLSVVVLSCCSAIFFKIGLDIGTQKELKKKYGSLRTEMIKDTAAFLCAESKFMEADSAFDELTPEEEETSISISQSLRIAECYARQDRKMKAKIAINATKRLLMTANFYDIYWTGENFTDDSCFRVGILIKTVAEMTMSETLMRRDKMYAEMHHCITTMASCIAEKIESGVNFHTIESEVQYLEEMFYDIRSIGFIDIKLKAKAEMNIAKVLYSLHDTAKNHAKSIEFGEIAVKIIEKEFANDKLQYEQIIRLKTRIGINYHFLNKLRKAELYYSEAIHSHKNAKDLKIDKSTGIDIKVIVNNLALIRAAEYESTASELYRLFEKER